MESPEKKPPSAQSRRPAAYRFTPARRAALDAARKKRTFVMTPAKWAAQRKATEANQRHYRLTRARRRAMGINARKMQRASVEKFRMTDRRLRANRASIRKAQAAERSPESYARSRFNRLKHGLQVRDLRETMRLLGEDPKEFAALEEGFARVFAVQNPVEQKVVRLLAAAVWRRLRLYKAQARCEADRLHQLLSYARVIKPLDAGYTLLRAHGLMALLLDRETLNRHDHYLTGVVERQLRTLLRLRGVKSAEFKYVTRESREEKRAFEELEEMRRRIAEQERDERIYERLRRGGPEVEAGLRKFRRAWRQQGNWLPRLR